MAFKKYNLTDRGTAELGVDINASATQITLQNVEDLPTSNFTLTLIQEVDDVFIKSEKIYVTTRTGNICTNVIRGYAGSTAKSFDAGDKAQLLIIAEHIIDIQNEVTRINTLFSWKADKSGGNTLVGNQIIQGEVILNATVNTVFRLQDDGVETFALYSLANQTDVYLRSVWDTAIKTGGSQITRALFRDDGDITFGNASSTSEFTTHGIITVDNTFDSCFRIYEAGSLRWNLGKSSNETGSNVWSDFNIWRYDDSGNFLASAFKINRSTGKVIIDKDFVVANGRGAIGIDTPFSTFHVYQNDSDTSSTAGIIVEQDGTGDAIVQYLLTGVRRWVTGVDNSDADKFKISATADVGTGAFQIDTAGRVMVRSAGWTGDTFSVWKTFNFFQGGHNLITMGYSATLWEVTETGYSAEMRHVKSGSGGKGDFWICVDDTYRTAGDTLSSLYGKPVVKFGADRTEFRCTTRFMGGMYKNDSTNTDTFRIWNYYFWVDSTGDLRIKSSAPTGDTQGTVVGTQS